MERPVVVESVGVTHKRLGVSSRQGKGQKSLYLLDIPGSLRHKTKFVEHDIESCITR